MSKPLNIRQARFADFVASGMAAGPAYIKAGFQVSRSVAKANASRMLTNATVLARIAELRRPQTESCLMSLDEKRRMLARIVRTAIGDLESDSPLTAKYTRVKVGGSARGKLKKGTAPRGNEIEEEEIWQIRIEGFDKLRAIELDSKLAGHFTPERVEVDVGPTTLDEIRERANKVASILDLNARRAARAREAAAANGGNGTAGTAPAPARPLVKGLSRWNPTA
jgi:phage terminase small subunit